MIKISGFYLILNVIIVKSDIYEEIFNVILHIPSAMFEPINGKESEVSFYLFTRENPEQPIQIFKNNSNVLNKTKEFKYVVHGYLENIFISDFLKIKNSFLKRGDYNVILVDWNKIAFQEYSRSVQNSRKVGKIIAEQIVRDEVPVHNIELIGFSLGAHICGFTGKYIKAIKIGTKVKRIIGLDPAGPLFEFKNQNSRLAKDDADSVLVLHTDGGKFGMRSDIGTIEVYFNGGLAFQPACYKIKNFLNIPVGLFDNIVTCNHKVSITYFDESINSNGFLATKCGSYFYYNNGYCDKNEKMVIGESTPINASGRYYLETNGSPPYARN